MENQDDQADQPDLLIDQPEDPLTNFGLVKKPESIVGTDWRQIPADEVPLLEYEYKYLNSDILSNIKFFDFVGQGNFGIVWEVSADIKTYLKVKDQNPYDNPVWKNFRLACKIIRHKFVWEEEVLDSLNEMRILRYLRHENICNFFEIIGIPDRTTHFPYSTVVLFFELCDEKIDDIIFKMKKAQTTDTQSSYTLPERLSRHWFAQIARAVEYLHRNDVVHCDIHTGNILYCGPNQIYQYDQDYFLSSIFKLADFGISRHIDLTPNVYQWTVERHRSAKDSDIKELGRVLYDTGVPAMKATVQSFLNPNINMNIFMNYCQTGEWIESYPQEWLHLSPAMKHLFCRLHDIENRITAEEILSHEWLQTNDEPLTEPFILRPRQINFEIQPSYRDWEDVREHPSPYTEPPFGKVQRRDKEFNPVTRQWITAYDPIQGAPNMHELIDSFANN